MFSNYVKLALRHLLKHKGYAAINIIGLAIGMTLFLFSNLLVSYERNHDHMFAAKDRIYALNSLFAPTSGEPISKFPGARPKFGPIFAASIEQASEVARSANRVKLLSVGDKGFYEGIRFVDPGFTRIFDFNYLHGDPSALASPSGVLLTASMARKFFGRVDVLGQTLRIGNQIDLQVSAVIEDVPPDTHFNSDLRPNRGFGVVAPIAVLAKLESIDLVSGKGWTGYAETYLLFDQVIDQQWLQQRIDELFTQHAPQEELDYIDGLNVSRLTEQNNLVWESLGFPLLETVLLMGLLVLIVACVNYTNLATAQHLGRAREVGLRKALGANRRELLMQFLVESISLAVIASLLALAFIELMVPAYNLFSGKGVQIDYLQALPVLIVNALLVGLAAGLYPALTITRYSALDGLRAVLNRGRKGVLFRSVMIGAQFTISIFILALVMIIYFQNDMLRSFGNVFPKDEIVVLEKLDAQGLPAKYEVLRQQLLRQPGIERVSYSDSVPFATTTRYRKMTPVSGDESQSVEFAAVSVDEHFLSAYDTDILHGRHFDLAFAEDVYSKQRNRLNVVVNELAAKKLGFASSAEAVGQTYYKIVREDEPQPMQYTIIGVIPDQYFRGVYRGIDPVMYFVQPHRYRLATIRLNANANAETIAQVEQVWKQVAPEYPVQRSSLDYYFNLFFKIPENISRILSVFACIALTLALIGLFGLAAFMARKRTREIGIRKVLGASVPQIVRLLLWQFCKPVLWSLVVALPLAYFASNIYLNFYAERIGFLIPVVLGAAAIGLLTAIVVVSGHAIAIASTKPGQSLRYE